MNNKTTEIQQHSPKTDIAGRITNGAGMRYSILNRYAARPLFAPAAFGGTHYLSYF